MTIDPHTNEPRTRQFEPMHDTARTGDPLIAPTRPMPTMATTPPAPVPRRRPRRWGAHIVWAFVSVAALGIGIAIGPGGSDAPASPTAGVAALPAPTVTVTETAAASAAPVVPVAPATPAKPAPAAPASFTDDGGDVTGVVGDDLPAGKWEIRGADPQCFYMTDRKPSNDDTIDSTNTGYGGGHHTVHLKAGESFESQGCVARWVRTGTR
jgi:hypothetical protein